MVSNDYMDYMSPLLSFVNNKILEVKPHLGGRGLYITLLSLNWGKHQNV